MRDVITREAIDRGAEALFDRPQNKSAIDLFSLPWERERLEHALRAMGYAVEGQQQ